MTEEQRLRKNASQRAWAQRNPNYGKAWVHKNIERLRKVWCVRNKRRREQYPDKMAAYKKQSALRCAAHVQSAARNYYVLNSEKIKQKTKQWKLANEERKRELNRQYKKRHPHKVVEHQFRRRARLKAVTTCDCSATIATLKLATACHWCGAMLNKDSVTVDHVLPLSRGGHHAPDNLVAACVSCNTSKGNRLLSEWRKKAA